MEKSSLSEAEKRIIIGKVGAPHGVKGEFKVIPMTDFPERFGGMRHCVIGDTFVCISGVRYQKKQVLMTVEGVDTREKAATLTGALLSVDRSEAMPLKDGEYYTMDILGLAVKEIDGSFLGIVTDVIRTGSNDVYVVSLPNRQEDVLVPALKTVVREISVEDRCMVVSMPEVAE